MPCSFEMRLHDFLDLFQLIPAHGIYLSDAEDCIIDRKLFKVKEADFFRTLAFQIASGIEHLLRQSLHLDSGDLCQRPRRLLIQRSACRRPEHQSIGNNRRTQKGSMYRLHKDAFLLIHLIYDGRSTSYRLIAEKYRSHCFNAQPQPVVVDDLQHIRFFHTIHCLAPFIVVHKDHLLFLYIEDTSS